LCLCLNHFDDASNPDRRGNIDGIESKKKTWYVLEDCYDKKKVATDPKGGKLEKHTTTKTGKCDNCGSKVEAGETVFRSP
jgi:hypothetical protein